MSQIELKNVTKDYLVAKKRKGMLGVLKGLIHSEKIKVEAVKGISLRQKKARLSDLSALTEPVKVPPSR